MSASKTGYVNCPWIALFASGMFAGGAVDHVVLALMRSPLTPYGVRSGVAGNWLFEAIDALVAIGLLRLTRVGPSSGRSREAG